MNDKDENVLGRRLKSIRKEKGWTLSEVARRTGISVSTLSKLENGLTRMNFTSVRKLAQGLNLPVTELTRAETEKPVISARRSLTPLGGGMVFETEDVDYEILCNDLSDNQQGYIKAVVKCRDPDEIPSYRHHEGQEFIYVLEGTLELHTESYAPTVLNAGDSILFDSAMGHKYVSRGDRNAVLLISMPMHEYADVTDQLDEITN